jgi:RHS repeat-associated protein
MKNPQPPLATFVPRRFNLLFQTVRKANGNHQSILLQSYAYQLNKNGHRTQITELSGRVITNTFDKLHRLTAEGIVQSGPGILPGALTHPTGTLSYSYDSVGNRTSRTTTGPVATIIPSQTQSFTVNDRLTTDTYDSNGNTTSSLITDHGSLGSNASDIYSFDNRLIRRTTPDGKTIDLTYNPDGHRLSKFITQNALTQRLVHYLTDANNPTGYAQVIEEKHPLEAAGSQLKKVNLYGHDLISSLITDHSALITKPIFYQYDGLGSVRSITDTTGDLQETYDYAYGTLIGLNKRNPLTGVLESSNLSSTIPNLQSDYLFTGEQWDEDLGMYFLRARYLNTNTGRFHSQDSYEGRNGEPLTLHKYLYAHGNPAMFTDPSGRFSLAEMSTAIQVSLTLGVITGFTVPLIRGPGDDIDGATYTELFAKCLYRNGGALAITVVGIAVGIDWGGEPLPKIGDELRSGFGGRAKSEVTTRLSRLSRQLNTWLKEELALTRRPGIRSLRVAGRLANAARGITNVVGAFAVGYTVGLIPGCALTAYLYKE